LTTRNLLEGNFKRSVDLSNYTWKNRRRMAWLAFWSMVVFTALCFFWVPESRLSHLDTIITWYYMAAASIVGAYMGFSTYASVNGGGGEPYGQSYQAAQPDQPADDKEGFFVPPDEPKVTKKKGLRMRGLPQE
jgi:hypothetical protein